MRQPLGQRILRYASLDDIAIWGVLALILLDWERMGKQIFFLSAFGVLSMGLRRLMQAIESVTANTALHTRDLGGQATTRQVTDAVCRQLAQAR